MALTRDFRETVVERVQRDPKFARRMLDGALEEFLNGDAAVARDLLRDVVNATVGFEALASHTDRPPKSLHRMLSSHGNPSMDNLSAILTALRQVLDIEFRVKSS